MAKRTIRCPQCGQEHFEDSEVLVEHQRLFASDPRAYGKPVEKPEAKQAKFLKDVPVKVSFSAKPVNRREPNDEPADSEFHIVYIDFLEGQGPSDAGEAYPQEHGGFDVEVYVSRSAQPYAFQILNAAVRFFKTNNVSIEYTD